MKGVVLAGGKATRLRPLTKVTNKHLLPIYDKPLIYYPLQAMARAGIRDVLVITNPEHAGHFIQLLGSGREFGLKLAYELQEEAGGLAQAVSLAETFVGRDKMLVLLGDNIFTHDLRPAVERFCSPGAGCRDLRGGDGASRALRRDRDGRRARRRHRGEARASRNHS